MKNTIVIILLLFFNYTNAQFLQNGSFETINGSTNILQTAFTQQQLGPNWYAYENTSPNVKSNGFQNVNATNGTKFAHTWHKLESLGGPNWKRTGQAFFMYYPMQGGEHYNVQFDLKSSKTGTRFYVVAVNDLVPNTTGTQVNHILPTNATNNLNNIISNTGHKEFVNPINNYIANTGWNPKSYNFQPTQNFKYLLFIPYIELNGSNLSTKQADFYVDNVKMTGNLASTVFSMALNGQDSDTNIGINICSEEDVILDASKSVDTHLHLRSYVQINQQNGNGTTSKWSTHTIFGLPFNPINISQLYAQDGFSFSSPAGVQTEYRVKYSFNSGPGNQWFSRTMKVIVDGGPNFNFGGMINWININGGFSATSNVTDLPAGNYSYEWYEGTTTNTPVIGSTNEIQVYKSGEGDYPYTVRVTDLSTGCSAVKTTRISYHQKGGKRSFGKQDNNTFKVYPNPAADQINVSTNRVYDSVNIYTLRNNLVIKTKGKKIDVSSLKKGIYIMKFFNGDKIVETKKIIKN